MLGFIHASEGPLLQGMELQEIKHEGKKSILEKIKTAYRYRYLLFTLGLNVSSTR